MASPKVHLIIQSNIQWIKNVLKHPAFLQLVLFKVPQVIIKLLIKLIIKVPNTFLDPLYNYILIIC